MLDDNSPLTWTFMGLLVFTFDSPQCIVLTLAPTLTQLVTADIARRNTSNTWKRVLYTVLRNRNTKSRAHYLLCQLVDT